jgi:hypothetical protein
MGNANQPAAQKSTAVQRDVIKTHMPNTYSAILKKSEEVGAPAFDWVRRGLRGEANCFYAFENGYVVGTPFSVSGISAVVAQHMVQFGVAYCCIWSREVSHGTH